MNRRSGWWLCAQAELEYIGKTVEFARRLLLRFLAVDLEKSSAIK
jgi:hypothetical protein